MKEDECNCENSEKRAVSWLSSIGGVSASECLSSVNTSLETVVKRIEEGFYMDAFEADVRELCIEVNRLIKHIKTTGVHCTTITYKRLLATLARLRIAAAHMQKGCNGTVITSNGSNRNISSDCKQMSVNATFHAYKIQTPRLPEDLSV